MRGHWIVYLLASLILIVPASGLAAVPGQMSYQGQLLDGAGNPLPDGPKGMRIIIWDDSVASAPGNEVWNSGPLTVTTTGGLFTVILGAPPMPVIDPFTMTESSRWIGVTVGADPEMSPRIRLGSVPYSWTAKNADLADHADSADYAQMAGAAATATTAVTANAVQWSGVVNKPAGFGDNVDDNTTYSASSPVTLLGTTFGLAANSITNAHVNPSAGIEPQKIFGTAAILTGANAFTQYNQFRAGLRVGDSALDVSAVSQSVQMGRFTGAPDYFAVLRIARRFSNPGGAFGITANIQNAAAATLTKAGNFWVDQSAVSWSYGSTGTATTNSGAGVGVEGRAESNGSNGYGVMGTAAFNANGNVGVQALAQGPNPVAVYGEGYGTTSASWATYGVYGKADGTSQTSQAFGVYGYALNATVNNYAGWFEGRTHVNGTLSKNAGSFMIDHPLDPENKYLQHSFVESPDMMNIYNGNVVTDAGGLAVVTMPAWFEALNQDFRYQLTVIGQFAQAIISSKMNGNSFSIATDKPNVEVSWQVTGIRHDAYANAHRIQVEVDKQSVEKGKYLNPEAFKLGPSRGVHFEETKRFEKLAAEREVVDRRVREAANESN